MFTGELVHLAVRQSGDFTHASSLLRIDRKTAEYARRIAHSVSLTGPQAESVRRMASELAPLGYRQAVRRFAQLVAQAALREAPVRRHRDTGNGRHEISAAAGFIHLHRNSLRNILQTEVLHGYSDGSNAGRSAYPTDSPDEREREDSTGNAERNAAG
ncbi:MAG: hypothetical protein CXZ00_03155 [Acidobacteria bacterium]|nr:MAG: hypothetical protein CXZ00_03155 [Acidobacteriota bacterium]